jgi:hypothetical protein
MMKMKQRVTGITALMCILVLTVLSCTRATRTTQQTGTSIYNLGKASEFDIFNTIPRILRKYQYDVLHEYDTGSYQTIETEWKIRYPLEDEQEVGITDGKLRLFFRMRKTMDQLFYVRLEVQNMIKTPDTNDWFYAPMSDDLEYQIREMVEDLEQEFDEGRLTH